MRSIPKIFREIPKIFHNYFEKYSKNTKRNLVKRGEWAWENIQTNRVWIFGTVTTVLEEHIWERCKKTQQFNGQLDT